jgi:hypothetical protein
MRSQRRRRGRFVPEHLAAAIRVEQFADGGAKGSVEGLPVVLAWQTSSS